MIEPLIVILIILVAVGLLIGFARRALRGKPKSCCGSGGSACSGCAQNRSRHSS